MGGDRGRRVGVAVLHTEGCPATAETIRLVGECAAESGIRIDLRAELIDTQEDADRTRFLGSPTVQVEGTDIDPSVRDGYVFGFA
jgi:hypothetical protein